MEEYGRNFAMKIKKLYFHKMLKISVVAEQMVVYQ
jgi:hypothetical protein